MTATPSDLSSLFRRFADELDTIGSDDGSNAQGLGRLELARVILKRLRLRTRHFPAGLFSDPAWPMLLELYVSDATDRPISVSGLSQICDLSIATGIRWLRTLCHAGLVTRRPDPADARRNWVALTPEGLQMLEQYLGSAYLAPRVAGHFGMGGTGEAAPSPPTGVARRSHQGR